MTSKNEISEVCFKLKALRDRTGLSIAKVADALGYPTPSGYNHYETRYKKEYLPQDIVLQLIPLFERYGINRNELLELAGLGELVSMSSEGTLENVGLSSDTTKLYTRAIIVAMEIFKGEGGSQEFVEEIATEAVKIAQSQRTDLIDHDLIRWIVKVIQERGGV